MKTKGFLIIPFCSLRGILTGAFSPWAWPWISPSPVTFQSPPHFPVNLEHFQLFICSLPHSLCVISMICFLTLYFPSQNTTFFFCPTLKFPTCTSCPSPQSKPSPNLILDRTACLKCGCNRGSILLTYCIQLRSMGKKIIKEGMKFTSFFYFFI